ncbi:MAG: DUF433 domain-containing protein [Armatimonadota bacterium]|nr:DUF433 domain-containing protein [Armatimonadota bacterium]
MSDPALLARIISDPKVMAGKPIIHGTRISVEYILKLLAYRVTEEEVLAEYDGMTGDDIAACLLFASKSLEESAFMPLPLTAA